MRWGRSSGFLETLFLYPLVSEAGGGVVGQAIGTRWLSGVLAVGDHWLWLAFPKVSFTLG